MGLAVAYHLTRSGARVELVDRDPDGDRASFGNAGGIAVTEVVPASMPGVAWRVLGWMLDPLGPLAVRPAHIHRLIPWLIRFAKVGTPEAVDRISRALAAINLRVYDDLRPMLQEIGLSGELHHDGALTVYETDKGYRRDAAEWACKRLRGIEVQELGGAEARELEPALGSAVKRAVFTPQWSHVSDPRLLVVGVADWLRRRGIVISRGEVRNIVPRSGSHVELELEGGLRLAAGKVVIATGAWSAKLVSQIGDRVLLESERGYNVTLPQPNVSLGRELIFAEHRFVATPLRCGLRVGGAAEFGGLEAAANFKRSRSLLKLAARYLPGLRTEGGTEWAGHRPTTPDSLPVIGRSTRQADVFYAFGHGHLGLTQAATTGRLVCDLIFERPTVIDITPYAIDRFA